MARGTGNITVLAITAVLLTAAIYEGGLGLLQLLGMEPSGNRLYPFTGTFYNPGPFACYLALSLPWALYTISNEQLVISNFYKSLKIGNSGKSSAISNCQLFQGTAVSPRPPHANEIGNFILVSLAWIVICIDSVLLPASMSRTAWCAAVVGSVVALFGNRLKDVCRRRPGGNATPPTKNSPLPLYSSLLVIIAICSLLIVGVYRMKQGSADGRFLMWKVAAGAVGPHPFEGVGWQNVAGAYGMAQERYFASGTASPGEILVADAPEYVFNEYLQIAIAYGWGWSLLMIAVLIMAFVSAFRSGRYGIAGSVAACAVVMTASYPFQFPISILTIGAICIAAFIGRGMCVCRGLSALRADAGQTTQAILSAHRFFCTTWSRRDHVSLIPLPLTSALKLFFIAFAFSATVFLTIDCKKFDQNVLFQTGLALHNSGQWEKSNEVMMDLLSHSSDPMPLNIIGKNYTELNIRDSAEYYLHRSTLRCPNRLYPHYLLMKLYLRQPADSAAARREAKILLSTKEKVPSLAVEQMRKEAVKLMLKG